MASVSVYTDLVALEGLVPEWRQLVARTIGATVYQTPEWALSWLRALGKHMVPFGIALHEGNRLVGFAPLCIESVWGVRVAQFMGGELNDFNCLLAEPEFLDFFRIAACWSLEEHAASWDAVALTALDCKEPWGMPMQERPARAKMLRLEPGDLPTIHLSDTFAAYFGSISVHRRKRLRYAQRHLEDRGRVTFQVLTEPGEIGQALGSFFAARTMNWRERKRLHRMVRIQRRAVYWSTLTKICLELAALGQVWLGQIAVNNVPVSWDLAFVTNGIVSDYMTTYDLRYAKSSPGQLVLLHTIRFAIEQRMSCFVLGRGAQAYKYWHGARPRETENLILYANGPRGRAFVGMRALRERAIQTAQSIRTCGKTYSL